MLVLQRMKLVTAAALVTEISRSAAFVQTALQTEPGRRVAMRVTFDGGEGIAVGQVQTKLRGTGFTVRILASTEDFRIYVDSVRSYLRGDLLSTPALTKPISVQVI
jgi:hypothetical protein